MWEVLLVLVRAQIRRILGLDWYDVGPIFWKSRLWWWWLGLPSEPLRGD